MSKSMSIAPMDLELSAIGLSKEEIKRLRRHLKHTGAGLAIDVVAYAVSTQVMFRSCIAAYISRY